MDDEEAKREQNISEIMDWVRNEEKWFQTPRYAGKHNIETCGELNLLLGLPGKSGSKVYHEELGQYIAYEFSRSPRNLTYFCKHDSRFPRDVATIYTWEKKYPEFGELMRQARELKAHLIIEESMELADEVDVEDKFGSARVSKAKLQIGVRERVAKRYNREVYGDVKEVNLNANLTFTQLVQQMRDASPQPTYRGEIDVSSSESTPSDNRELSGGSGLVSGESTGRVSLAETEGDSVERQG